jgi:hypothetical protein
MPNGFAFLVLAISPLVFVAIFRSLPPGRALILSFLGAYLLLPPQPTAFDFPLVPALNKETLPSLTVLILCLVMYRDQLKLIPEAKLVKVFLALVVLAPIGTTITNLEPVYFGRIALPGMSPKDMLSVAFRQMLEIMPFLLARNFLYSREGHRDLLLALVIGGLIYSLPMLLEIQLSPQLNIWIYGFFQHNFEQMIRGDGYRPIVFLYHGLWAAFFMMTCVAAAVILLRAEEGRIKTYMMLAAAYLFVVLVLCKSLASLIYVVFLVPLILLVPRRLQLWAALGFALLALAYPAMKGAGLVPEAAILEQAAKAGEDRAGSLEYRFNNENILLDRAMEKPLFGWGSWGRNQIFNPVSGAIETVSDGYWVIALGVFGWVGWLGIFGLMLSPVFLLWKKYKGEVLNNTSPYVVGLALLLSLNVFDLLPNATLTPMTWLIAGALLGHIERGDFAVKQVAVKLKSVM